MTIVGVYGDREVDFESPREALLQLTCAALSNLGFKQAWVTPVYDELEKAFDACKEYNLQPRHVISVLLQIVRVIHVDTETEEGALKIASLVTEQVERDGRQLRRAEVARAHS